ncbi:MAG: hypothetical protein ACOH1H_06140 [Brevundimonas sp.]
MRQVLVASLGLALVLIGSCADKPQEALDLADGAYSAASTAQAQVDELELRVDEIEYRLNM